MTTSTTIKLTEKSVSDAHPDIVKGEARARLYVDKQRTGFGLSVSKNSVKSFFVQRRVAGKTVRYVFGKFGELTVAQARVHAEQLLAKMAMGENPMEERRAAREEAQRAVVRGITLGEALTMYERYLKAKKRSAITQEEYRQLVERNLEDWLDRPLVDITRADCRKRHEDIARGVAKKRGDGFGEIAANKTLRAFRAIYNRASEENPDLPPRITASVNWHTEKRRESRIAVTEFPGWMQQVLAEPNEVRRDFLRFVLFTGLRRTNAAEVKWEHVDFEQCTLLVPKPKSQTPFTLPLTQYLIDILKRRDKANKKLAPDSPFVFPAAAGEGHIVETRIEGDIQYTNHDLRRTFITVAESLDISPYAIKLLVNHSMPKSDVTGGYIIPELERLRDSMQRITDRLIALSKAPTNKVASKKKQASR
jgi:integrase